MASVKDRVDKLGHINIIYIKININSRTHCTVLLIIYIKIINFKFNFIF